MRIVDEARKKIEAILEGKEDERIFGKEVKEEAGRVSEGKKSPEKKAEEKEVKTYRVVINGMEIEVPEGFEVVVEDGETIIRESATGKIVGIAEEVLKELKAIREEGIEIAGPVVTV
ncbi:MAG: hypothetical protein Q9N34_06720 [Aquificota bacterium]|nr:hypothetical protein [Aquificota bacterium]